MFDASPTLATETLGYFLYFSKGFALSPAQKTILRTLTKEALAEQETKPGYGNLPTFFRIDVEKYLTEVLPAERDEVFYGKLSGIK